MKLGLKLFFENRLKEFRFLFMIGILLTSFSQKVFAYDLFDNRIEKSQAVAHYAMGQIYDLLGMTNNAVLEYERSLQSDNSSSYLPYLRLGANYARLNMLPEAKQALFKVKELDAEELQSHYLLALIYSAEKDYEKSAGEYEFILKKFSSADPQNIEIYGYLAQLYYSQKKYNQAIIQFEKILELEPENVEVYGYLAQLYYSQKNYNQAIAQFEKILELDADNADVMYMLGSLYLEINDNQKAIDIFKKSIQVDPDHDGSLNTLGYLYAEIGENLDEAETFVERALELSPDNGAYLDSLGWVYFKKGDYEKAVKALLDADKVMKDPVIYEHLGDVYNKMDKIDEAIKYWKLSLELNPDQKEVGKKLEEAKLRRMGTQVSISN